MTDQTKSAISGTGPQRLAGVGGAAGTTVKCSPDLCDFTPPLLIRTCTLRSKTLQHFYGNSAGGRKADWEY